MILSHRHEFDEPVPELPHLKRGLMSNRLDPREWLSREQISIVNELYDVYGLELRDARGGGTQQLARCPYRRPLGDSSAVTRLSAGDKAEHRSTPAPAPQRRALPADAARIQELMRASVLDLFPRFYNERQTASAAIHIAYIDMQLIEDGTYFVHEAGEEIVACGGWSRRAKLYTGSGDKEDDDRLLDAHTEPARVRAMFVRGEWTRRGLGRAILESCERAAREEGFRSLVLGATLPGEPLYTAFGFREVERFTLTMPDGVSLDAVAMERPIERP